MKRFTRREVVAGGLALCATAGLAGKAHANGDEFFGIEELGPVEFLYFGSVKDDQGKVLAGAEVTIRVSEPQLIFVELTDVVGRFRTLDIGRALLDRGYEVDPSLFNVSASLPGYTQLRKFDRRPQRLNKGSFEVNFVMKKAT